MAGRGRGRGRNVSFNVEALGFGRGEALPGSTLQPPPLFPPQEFKPVALLQGEDYEYILALKQEFRGTMRKSPYYLQPVEKKRDIERYSDKYQLGQQDTAGNWTPDWRRLPAELKSRDKKPRKMKAVIKPKIPTNPRTLQSKDVADVVKTLEVLEKKEGETKEDGEEEKDEDKEEGEEEEEGELYDEDELEEETDYIMPYFDNGEGYGDDDDDVDEGPVY